MTDSNTINVGVLGFAHGHVNSYCGKWRERPELRVRAVAGWDHDAERIAKAVTDHGIDACATAEQLLSRDDIGAVVIASETNLHADLVEQAAAAGKAIILQKPMATSLADADRIIAAVDKAGVPFTMAWQMRVDPQNLRMKQLIEDGAIGRVLMVRRRHGLSTHIWGEWFTQSWHTSREHNVGMWADDASHAIDFLLWLCGKPKSVIAEIDTLLNPDVPDDNGLAIYRYDDGMFAHIDCSFTLVAGENTTEIVGDKGVIIQNFGDAPSCNAPRPDDAVGLKWYLHDDKQWHDSGIASPKNHGERIAALHEPLAEFLHGTRNAIATAQDGKTALHMTLACYDAAREGNRIEL